MAQVSVLGPTLVDGERLSPLQSRVLTALVSLRRTGATVPTLTGLVWGEEAPRTARASLQNQVTALRRALGDEAIEWDGERYRLTATVRTDLDDLHADIALVDGARSHGDPAQVLELTHAALARFRGPPFSNLPDGATGADRAAGRVTALRARLREARADALVGAGRTEEGVAAWRELVDETPLHEGRWAGLIRALDAGGRRADALDAYREAREVLRSQLGLAPGPTLEAAHTAVLQGTRPRVDRDAEVLPRHEVTARVHDTLAAHRVVALVGPAGAGKTTLLSQLEDTRLGGRTVHVDCGSSPWTALEPLRELLEALGADPISNLSVGAGDVPGQVAAAVADAASERPLLLTVDDAAAGGPTTWRALSLALADAPELRLAIACRTGEPPPAALGEVEVVDVPPFDTDEVRGLVELVLRRRGGINGLVDWLRTTTGGNPLFVRELVTHLRERGGLERDQQGDLTPPDRAPAPERLQTIVSQRLGSLGLHARRTCDVLAVVAPVDDVAVLDAIGVETRGVATLRAADLLTPGPRIAFRHAALQEVARELTPPGRRIEIALVAADALTERGAPATAIARMRLAAAEVDPLGAAVACRDAARAAAAEQAFAEAVEWSDRGLSLLEATERSDENLSIELAVAGADAARLGGLAGHAGRLLTAAERAVACSDADVRREATLALLRLGECCQAGEEQQRAVALGEEALRLEDDADHAARIHASLSLTHSMVDPTATRQHIDLARERLATNDDDALAVEVLPYAYMSVALPDDLDDRAAAATRLAQAAGRLGDPVAAYEADHLAFSVALQRGTRDELDGAHQRMEAARRVVADAGRRWSLHYQRATLAQLDGDIEETTALAAAARDVGVTVAAGRAWATWSAQTLELHRLAGTLAELAPVIVPLADSPGALPAWRSAAAFVLAQAEPDRAMQLLGPAAASMLDGVADFSTTAALQVAARAAVLLEDTDTAARLLPRLRPWADLWSWQGTTTYGPLGDVVADLGELVGDQDAAAAGRSGAAAARDRLGALGYP